MIKESKTNTTVIPIHQMFVFIEAHPKIFTGFEIINNFQRNSNKIMLYTDGNNEYKVDFENLSLMLPQIQFKKKNHVNYMMNYVYLMNL